MVEFDQAPPRPKNKGGRPLGTINKLQKEQATKLNGAKMSPLDYLLSLVHDPEQPASLRKEAAVAAAPYVHSKQPTYNVNATPKTVDVTESDEAIMSRYLSQLVSGDAASVDDKPH